jgi:hypothetical protein
VSEHYRAMARAAARAERLPEDRFERQIGVESVNYNEDVIACRRDSPAGARGVAQLMSVHWNRVNPCDPPAALGYAARLMRGHIDYWLSRGYDQETAYALALSSYNAGRQATIDGLAGRLAHKGWPYGETVGYLVKILGVSEAQSRAILTGGTAPMAVKLSEVLERARSRAGDPYVWGGKAPGGFDCSGFVAWAYEGQVPSFTDSILPATERVEPPAPGDIVLYEYQDAGQPGVRFPHVGLFLDDATTLDARFGHGVGVHGQLPRSQARRYYRRLPGVIVDTVGQPPAPPPEQQPDPRDARIAQLEAEKAQLVSTLGYLTGDVAAALQSAVDTLKRHAPA